ncbi:MAG TPA: Rne/Rng family ribonuclease [Candidatus Acidoferrum sp.]|nr:Rne/Rng family ribonuclease [Candidatus Acidoferrum sp.]
MSKELVISAASHERRVAILEEGQLVEIYIEREKEFALVGSIYKGRVTRVLPGMQSAFVDIGLDGDAFLYVSDVFENLEDYDHDHGHGQGPHASSPIPPAAALVEALPGESLANAHGSDEPAPFNADDAAQQTIPREEPMHADFAGEHEHDEADPQETHGNREPDANRVPQAEAEERQPESNASAPQNFGQFNPTQKYSRPDRGNDRGGGQDFRGDRGGDRGRGRFGRRGGRRRGGRPPQGGRNLPPSKYASPQGEQRPHDSRGNYDSRGSQPGRGFEPRDHRRPEGSRFSAPPPPATSGEDDIVLPGESLAKYRNKPAAAAAPAPAILEPELLEPQPDLSDSISSRGNVQQSGTPSGGNVPRRSSGGLPRWLLAETGNDTELSSTGTEEVSSSAEDTTSAAQQNLSAIPELVERAERESPHTASSIEEEDVSDEDVAVISSSLIEAKHEETQAKAAADTLVGGAVFEEEDEEEEEDETEAEDAEDSVEEREEIHASEAETESQDVGAEEIAGIETRALDAHALAEAEADAAHESALHAAAIGDHDLQEETGHEPVEATGTESAPAPAIAADDSILLPGETRAPRSGAPEPHRDSPRDSARIGGNPRARFQRPFRSGGRDRDNRGRDNRGPGGRPDRRGGRPGGGPRFERRPGGGPRHHGGHSGPSRRPQLISEMLKAGQDIVIQIAKEPLGKKGARITSHVALPGRFLVYMPTIDHIGVSRKIASADNRSRLRRLVGEARGAYPGGFIVRTAAGGASDEEIRTDIEFLGKTWNEIKERSEQRKAPALLHRDLNLVERILRDYVSDDFTAIWIDSEEEYGKVVEFVSRFQPKLVNRVKLYSKETPIFEEFGIQHELDKALRAKVWLKSGGYIVINHTEALVAIDVNTGKFVGKGSTRLEDTIVKTNLEAVKEIVRQIRLRDLGGIIVVDFIDMEERRNREKVLMALQQALEQDKAPSKALSFNEFGLVCITRKRTKQALERVLCQPCPYCTGSGMVKSIPTLCYEIQAETRKMAVATADNEAPNLTLRVHPEIAKALKTRESMLIDELEQTTHKHIIIQSDATLHWEQYDIC